MYDIFVGTDLHYELCTCFCLQCNRTYICRYTQRLDVFLNTIDAYSCGLFMNNWYNLGVNSEF